MDANFLAFVICFVVALLIVMPALGRR